MKKIIIGILLVIFCFNFSFAAKIERKKFDMKPYGNIGYACAHFLGDKKELQSLKDLNKLYKDSYNDFKLIDCKELSKREYYLMWCALDEYNYQDGEVYYMLISDKDNILIPLFLVVCIKNKGNSVDWLGFYLDTKNGK